MASPEHPKIGWRSAATTIILILFSLSPAGWSQGRDDGGKRGIDVATANMYVGADFSPVLTLDPSNPNYGFQLLSGVATIYGHIRQSNVHGRVEALAQEIVARAPDLVALQEVTLIRRQTNGDAIVGGATPATNPELDYLAILLAALQRYGGQYAVVSQVQDIDVEVPLVTGASRFDDIRLTDRDVILARTDLPPGHLRTSNPQSANFTARLPLPLGLDVLRGWCSIDVQVRGRSFRFINAHLEDQLPPPLPDVQLLQTIELLTGPANTSLPVILAGDFNSDAYGNYSPAAYSTLINDGGFTDAWSVAGGRALGLTWGHDQFLSDLTTPFLYRLDHILFRGRNFDATDAQIIDPVIGSSPPLWFSDHAGLFVTLPIK